MSIIRNPRLALGYIAEIADAGLAIEALSRSIERRQAAGEATAEDEARLDRLLLAQAERIAARITGAR